MGYFLSKILSNALLGIAYFNFHYLCLFGWISNVFFIAQAGAYFSQTFISMHMSLKSIDHFCNIYDSAKKAYEDCFEDNKALIHEKAYIKEERGTRLLVKGTRQLKKETKMKETCKRQS